MITLIDIVKQVEKLADNHTLPELKERPSVTQLRTQAEKNEHDVDEDTILELRKELRTILENTADQLQADAHNLLLTLAEFKPINERSKEEGVQGFIDPITLDTISEENEVFVSTGRVFDIKALITSHRIRDVKESLDETDDDKCLVDPTTNKPFHPKDSAHIQQIATDKNIIIDDSKPLPPRASFIELVRTEMRAIGYSHVSNEEFMALSVERARSLENLFSDEQFRNLCAELKQILVKGDQTTCHIKGMIQFFRGTPDLIQTFSSFIQTLTSDQIQELVDYRSKHVLLGIDDFRTLQLFFQQPEETRQEFYESRVLSAINKLQSHTNEETLITIATLLEQPKERREEMYDNADAIRDIVTDYKLITFENLFQQPAQIRQELYKNTDVIRKLVKDPKLMTLEDLFMQSLEIRQELYKHYDAIERLVVSFNLIALKNFFQQPSETRQEFYKHYKAIEILVVSYDLIALKNFFQQPAQIRQELYMKTGVIRKLVKDAKLITLEDLFKQPPEIRHELYNNVSTIINIVKRKKVVSVIGLLQQPKMVRQSLYLKHYYFEATKATQQAANNKFNREHNFEAAKSTQQGANNWFSSYYMGRIFGTTSNTSADSENVGEKDPQDILRDMKLMN